MTTLAARQLGSRIAQARSLGVTGRRRRVPNARPPTLIETEYGNALAAIVGRMRHAARKILDDLPRLLRVDEAASARDVESYARQTGDQSPGWTSRRQDWVDRSARQRAVRLDDETGGKRARRSMEQVRAEMDAAWNPTALEDVAEQMAQRTSGHQRGEFARQAQAALGVDIVTLDPKVPSLIDGFVHENVALIRKLQNTTLDGLETTITRAFASGTRAEVVAVEIEKRFGMSERHARLIARDQIGKLNGQVTAARHHELGLTHFEWQSMNDNRVRPRHRHLNGKVFEYAKPPPDGLPGTPIVCRCVPKPIFDNVLAAAAPAPTRTSVAQPAATKPVRAKKAKAGLDAPIVSTQTLGGGVNETKIVRYSDGSEGVWKPNTGESAEDLPRNIKPGSMYRREVAAYQVARDMGIDIVPETIERSHEGVVGSVQRFTNGTPAFKRRKPMDRASAEELRVLDFVTGNIDRHDANLIVSRDGKAVAIDNGLAFPSGRAGPQQPRITTVPYAGQGLLDATRERIAALDLRKIAATLRANGLDSEAVRHTLYRAKLLQEQPDVISVPERIMNISKGAQADIFIEPALTAETGLSAAGKAEVDAIVGGP